MDGKEISTPAFLIIAMSLARPARNSASFCETAGVSEVIVDDDRDLALLTTSSGFVKASLSITGRDEAAEEEALWASSTT